MGEQNNNNNIMTSIAPVSLNNIETQWCCEYNGSTIFNPYPADHGYCCFSLFLFVIKITDIGKKICAQTSRFAKDKSQIKQI